MALILECDLVLWRTDILRVEVTHGVKRLPDILVSY